MPRRISDNIDARGSSNNNTTPPALDNDEEQRKNNFIYCLVVIVVGHAAAASRVSSLRSFCSQIKKKKNLLPKRIAHVSVRFIIFYYFFLLLLIRSRLEKFIYRVFIWYEHDDTYYAFRVMYIQKENGL